MTERKPESVIETLVEEARGLGKLHAVRPLDIIAFQLGMLAQLAGPKVTCERREGCPAWPFVLVTQNDEPPAWMEPILAPLREEQAGLVTRSDGLIRSLCPDNPGRMKMAAEHFRAFGDLFQEEARECEQRAGLAAKPPASTFVHFVDNDGPLLRRKGKAQAGDGVSVVVDGDQAIRKVWRARDSGRGISRHLAHPDLKPRAMLAGRFSEKTACKLVRGQHALQCNPRPLLLPIHTGKSCDGEFSSWFSQWRDLLPPLLGHRYAGLEWEFKPSEKIAKQVKEAEEQIANLVAPLGSEATSWAAGLLELPWKITILAHYVEHGLGTWSFRHGVGQITAVATDLARIIAKWSVRWLDQVLPGPESGLTEFDIYLGDYIRRLAPVSSAALLSRIPGLRAAQRDDSLARLLKAGHVSLSPEGEIKSLVR